jgi:hypothetical protein
MLAKPMEDARKLPDVIGFGPCGVSMHLTVHGRTRIVAAFRPFWPPKRARCSEAFHEIPLSWQGVSQVGAIPGLIGGPAYKRSHCYNRSAGLWTARGPLLRTCV